MLNIAVIIPSVNRAPILHETVESVLRQSRPPSRVIICVSSASDIAPATADMSPLVVVIHSEKGLTRQRNRAIESVPPEVELVTFLDDDVELRHDYLEMLSMAFEANPDLVLASGRELAIGAHKQRSDREEARSVLARDAAGGRAPLTVRSTDIYRDVWGCNMSVRRRILDLVHFDERLPLYGWMEDFDFALGCARHGRVARIENCRLVHLVLSAGKPADKRLGFSQVMNPVYIWSKKYPEFPASRLVMLVGRCVIANIVKLPLPPRQAIHRWHRLAGNLVALAMVARGRLDPEYMTKL